jgi:hypothetical protein
MGRLLQTSIDRDETPLRQAFVWHGTLSIRNATRLVPHAT